MATPQAPASDSGPRPDGVLDSVIAAIQKVPKNAQAGLLTAVLLAIVALAGLRDLEDVDPGQIVLLGMVCAAILLAVLKKDAIPSVILLLVFVILGVGIHLIQPQPVIATPLPGDSANLQARHLVGRVQDVASRVGIKGVVVRAVETNAIDVTDEDGDFDLTVPQVKVRGDTIQLNTMYGSHFDSIFWQRVDGNRVKLLVPQSRLIAQVAGMSEGVLSENGTPFVRLMTLANTPGTQLSPLIIILDSIRTVRDGSSDDAHWSFDIEIDGEDVLEVARRPYDNEGDSRLVYVGAETTAELRRPRVTLGVDGTRKRFLASHRIEGQRVIDISRIPVNTPVPLEITVRPPGSSGPPSVKGHFQFYLTIIRVSSAG